MALAACQGGMAFTNSSVCLVHGMSRPIGAVFHLPHGLSNAVLLPAVTRFSISGAKPDTHVWHAKWDLRQRICRTGPLATRSSPVSSN